MSVVLRQLLGWAMAPKPLLGAVLSCLLIVSALGVAYASHQTRNMYRDLQQLEKDHDDLAHEYEKLLLEQSAWADYTRLDQLAQDKLAMRAPTPDEMVVIQ